MVPVGIKFAIFCIFSFANFILKGAILKIKCNKMSYLIFVVNMKFS